ncbi:MAG: hypothetical protein ACPGRW_06270 [Flavobacteriaceae bacterium]
MRKEKLYDILGSLFVLAFVGCFTWMLNADKKLSQVDDNKHLIELNHNDIRAIEKNQNENYIKILEVVNEINIKLENKKDRN